ncbi:hypothetical protein QDX92_004573 [Salmonella enterica]|nr:hypothetical protein [Salmonella enterica subsp. enterica serovar Sandiego]ECJ6126403.1 hypothetical protein [Salmonella enterica]EHH3360985.1 hypothetical protein [Salmonella enterica subsp. enterica serovar Sandiego]EJE9658060.1 hypothetical protein [Salmonella enterica]EJE9776431.1 hypothetical protein [Salmonella enterica]
MVMAVAKIIDVQFIQGEKQTVDGDDDKPVNILDVVIAISWHLTNPDLHPNTQGYLNLMKLDDTFQLSLNPGNINLLKDVSSQEILKTNWINIEWSTDFILNQWWDESAIAKFKEEHSDLIRRTTTPKDIMTHILIAEVNHKDFASMSHIFVHLVNDTPARSKTFSIDYSFGAGTERKSESKTFTL